MINNDKLQIDQPLSRHRSTEVLPSLTSAQIHLVRNIWRQVYVTKGPTIIGSTLLHGICFKSKKIKEQFFRCPFPHRFPNRDSFDKAHAKAIGEMLDKVSICDNVCFDKIKNVNSRKVVRISYKLIFAFFCYIFVTPYLRFIYSKLWMALRNVYSPNVIIFCHL